MAPALRILVAAAGWPGHAFPAFAAARELHARGHHVTVASFERWRELIEGMGMRFMPEVEDVAFPGPPTGSALPTIPEAARAALPAIRELAPDVALCDLYTLVPAFACDALAVPRASMMPHPYPEPAGAEPPFAWGLGPPRTALGARAWPLVRERFESRARAQGREVLNRLRAELGLPPIEGHLMVSEGLTTMQTFPQLEYPRRWPPFLHATGPALFEPPSARIELPPGPDPLVVVVASSGQDSGMKLLGTALEALAEEPVRVLASASRAGERWRGEVPDNAKVVDWLSPRQVLAEASLVVCRGGGGVVGHALAAGVPLLVCPEGWDQAETAVRVQWFGAGLMLPRRLLAPAPLRWATRSLLADRRFAARAGELAAWARANDGAVRLAELLEAYARSARD